MEDKIKYKSKIMENYINLIKSTIDGQRHSKYSETVRLQNKYTTWFTGKGLDETLRHFRINEPLDDYKERVRITNHIVPRVIGDSADAYAEAYRNNNIQIEIKGEQNSVDKMNGILEAYNGFESMDEYWEEKFRALNFTDPNAWIIPFFYTKEETKCYPVVINSDKMLNYGELNNMIEWCVFERKNAIYFITDGYFAKVIKKENNSVMIGNKIIQGEAVVDDYNKIIERTSTFQDKKGEQWIVLESEVYPYKDNFIVQVGYMDSNGIKIAPVERAESDIVRLTNLFSEYDVNLLGHIFAEKYQYAQKCIDPHCLHGFGENGNECHICHGTGLMPNATSGMQIGKIPLPETKEEMIELSKLAHYVEKPVEVLKIQKEEILDTIKNIRISVIGSDIFSRAELSQAATATEILSNDQNKNNKLYKFAQAYCKTYQFQVEKIADIIEVDISVSYWIDKSMVKESAPAMMKKITEAQNGGVPYGIIADLYDEYTNLLYAGDKRSKQKQYWRRRIDFAYGMSKEARMLAVASMPINSDARVQTMFSEIIINNAIRNNENFFEVPIEKQEVWIIAEVEIVKLQVVNVIPAINFLEE